MLEVLLVLGVSLGQSAVYSIVSFLDSVTRGPLRSQTTTLNPSLNARPVFDLLYQVLGNLFPLVPVALALVLLAGSLRGGARRIGLDRSRPGRDLLAGLGLALVVGIPGVALYLVSRAIGVNLSVDTSGIGPEWYAVPVLVLSALRAALQEEVIVVGYLLERLREQKWGPVAAVTASALLRGSYHLYQGVGGFVGNAIMGALFAVLYHRFGRVAPLVVAHFLLDLASFVGYGLARSLLPGLLA